MALGPTWTFNSRLWFQLGIYGTENQPIDHDKILVIDRRETEMRNEKMNITQFYRLFRNKEYLSSVIFWHLKADWGAVGRHPVSDHPYIGFVHFSPDALVQKSFPVHEHAGQTRKYLHEWVAPIGVSIP